MSFFKHIRLKFVPLMMALAILTAVTGYAYAQEATVSPAEEVVVEDSVAAVSGVVAEADTTGAVAEVAEVTTTTTATAAASKATVEPEKVIDPQVYKNFFYAVLLILLIAVVIGVIGKVISIYEMTTRINGRFNPLAANNFQANLMLLALPVFLYGVYWSFTNHGAMAWKEAATEHGKSIDTMFIVTTVICTIVLVIIHICLFFFSYKYRMRLNKRAFFYPHNNTIERIWTIVPAITLTILVLFGFFTWRKITNIPEDLKNSALQVEVLGEQFAWTVRYPGADGKIGKRNYKLTTAFNPYGVDFNDNASLDDILGSEIVLPVGKSVRFHILSKDILHSFYIPDFRVQINAVPGMTTYFQFTPTITTADMRDKLDDPNYDFVMLCNKICGEGHFNMKKIVRVVTEKEYQEWLATQSFFLTEDIQKEFDERNRLQGKTTLVDSLSSQVTAQTNL